MAQRQGNQEAVSGCDRRRPVSQYELARMVVPVLEELTRDKKAFTTNDVTREVRRRHPDCKILHYDQTWDGTPAPWREREPYRRGHVAVRGVQSLVHELMGVHLADEYKRRAVRSSSGHNVDQYVPLTMTAERSVYAA